MLTDMPTDISSFHVLLCINRNGGMKHYKCVKNLRHDNVRQH